MVETRVYITNDLSMKNVNNDVFIDHCEMEGGIYSLEGFQNAWNNDQLGNYIPDVTLMRIINIDLPDADERKLGYNYKMCSNTMDSDKGCVEWCPNCECEVLLTNEFKVQICPNCKKEIFPCNQCETIDCGNCPLGSKNN